MSLINDMLSDLDTRNKAQEYLDTSTLYTQSEDLKANAFYRPVFLSILGACAFILILNYVLGRDRY